MKLSIIIPAYNEEKNFQRGVLDEVSSYLNRQKYGWEVILVNDGSEDKTLELLRNFAKRQQGFRVLDIPHGGKVGAVSAGIIAARGDYVLFTDFDQSTPINEVEKVLGEFDKGVDVVIGQRVGKKQGWTPLQNLRSKIFNLLVQLITLPRIFDSQCGFKAFKTNIGKKLFEQMKITKHKEEARYMGAFDVELLFLAQKQGFKIKSVPVGWHYFASGKLSVSEPLKMLWDVIKVRVTDLLGGYNFVKKDTEETGYKKHLLPLILLLLLTIPAFRDTIKEGFFPMHDDLQFTRQLVMDECFKDRQFPCRWSKHLGYGYGFPLFNYYPPLPYYFGQIFRWMGLQYVDVVKVLVILNFIISGFFMYLLANEFWGRWGGLFSGIFYVYAPYHAVDIYARGAMNEAWAIVFFPGVFWSLYKLITKKSWFYVATSALFIAFLMLLHNPILMVFAPFAIIWTLLWIILTKNFPIFKLLVCGFWAVGLASFFTLPVILEAKYAHIETLIIGYFNYLAHFADLNQLFISRYWGFGDSRFGPVDDISFQIGHLHWILSLFSIIVAFIYARRKPYLGLMILLIFTMTTFYTFMTHVRSSYIWSAIPALAFLQFPWRFLSLSIFGASFLAGSIVLFINIIKSQKIKSILFALILLSSVFLYKDYFRWKDHWPWVTDGYRYTEELWRQQITSGIFDYLPIWAPKPPGGPPNGDAEFVVGEGEITTLFKNSIRQEYKVNIKKDSIFQINTFYFPGWKYFINGREVLIDPYQDKELGRPRIKLIPGQYSVVARFTESPVRVFGNSLSFISWGALIIYLLFKLRWRLTS